VVDLEYRIGGLYVIPDRLKLNGPFPHNADHRFVVDSSAGAICIYVAKEQRHKHVVQRFEIQSRIVGGGSCYLDREGQLVLADYSCDYGAVPKEVELIFAKLMLPELERLGIAVSGVSKSVELYVDFKEKHMNSFWKELGFNSQQR